MTACEPCWNEAYRQSRLLGGSQVDHYRRLLEVLDGHPHTLSFLAGVRGDRIRCLGVTEFGQSSDLADAYALHGIDSTAIIDAALGLLDR